VLKEGLIKHGEELRVQVIADASGTLHSTRKMGTWGLLLRKNGTIVIVLKVISLRVSGAICRVKIRIDALH
jgi:hypothetical protein